MCFYFQYVLIPFIFNALCCVVALGKLNNNKLNQTLFTDCNRLQPPKNCKQSFDSRINKSGSFESPKFLDLGISNPNSISTNVYGRIQCRYEFYGSADERIQIKFHDFYIPPANDSTTECNQFDSLQLLTQVRSKYEPLELYCGAFLPKPLMSNGPKMILQFLGRYPILKSKVGSYYGFKAEYKFVTNYGITTGRQIGNNCTFAYNSTERKSGWFGSPNFPGFYPQNIQCNYFFYGETDERVTIRFTYFDVEGIANCDHSTASDYVEFSNFMSTDRKFLKYCGKREKFSIRSDSIFFRVTFYSNDRFDKTGFRAFFDFESQRAENTSTQSYVSEGAIRTVQFLQKHWIIFTLAMIAFSIKNM